MGSVADRSKSYSIQFRRCYLSRPHGGTQGVVAVEYAMVTAALAICATAALALITYVFSPVCQGIGETLSRLCP